jgi:hypothetical protein
VVSVGGAESIPRITDQEQGIAVAKGSSLFVVNDWSFAEYRKLQ